MGAVTFFQRTRKIGRNLWGEKIVRRNKWIKQEDISCRENYLDWAWDRGDCRILTIKALRLIRENEVIAVPGNDIYTSVAYQIVKGVYDELDSKHLISVAMPMTKDKAALEENHRKAAEDVENYLKQGKNVVFLTLGKSYRIFHISVCT